MRKTNVSLVGAAVALLAVVGVFATQVQANLVITNAVGHTAAWDGNDGDFNGGPVPDNLALASNGATAFAGSELSGFGHLTVEANDGIYGNANSWIGDGSVANDYIGIDFGQSVKIGSVAWGRDNNFGDLPQFNDRYLGVYTLQYTQSANPQSGGAVWTDIADFNYVSNDDLVIGGDFSGYLRHEYDVRAGGGAIMATGIRLLVPDSSGLAAGTAVDELEAYLIPEPASIALLGLGGLMGLRRQRA